ncbi:putative phosphatidylinositol 3-related kinase [Trypanosoma conorhini]|uniref:non-specific serine/threonine protein kinase n=1 Tax=Trypanosoma conorhini TaxID=83891 RepID=A0A422Q1C1_9TRYP|nr:putative phosphatidylinositol 3-related kinase [Trypanosoma conorhini]RNF23811.1 putative phosphatidylinositol 3-related kinase [Trypanosoma conorhini]
MNETSVKNPEEGGSRTPRTAVKRPRVVTEDSAPLREVLKAFGQRATALDGEVAACDNPPFELQAKLWTLVLDIRPYVLATLSSNVLEVPEEMNNLCHAGSRRVLKYLWFALRIYVSVARIAAVVPGVLLHSILTLLSLLPVLGAPHLLGKANEETLYNGLCQAFILLSSRSPSLFRQLFHALLRDDTMGAFVFPHATGKGRSYGRCVIKISDPPVVHGVSSDAESLFTSTIVADSVYEGVCVARALCNIMRELFESNVPFQPTLDRRDILLRLSCGLLTLDLQEGPLHMLAFGYSEPLEGASGGYAPDKPEIGLVTPFQTSAGALLRVMMSRGLLIKSIHGPRLLYTLLGHLSEMSCPDGVDWKVTWELELLRWLTETRVKSTTASNLIIAGELKEGDALAGDEAMASPHTLLETLAAKPNVLNHVIRALIGCVRRQTSPESLETGAVLLEMLKRAMSHVSCISSRLEEVFYDVAAEMMNALLDFSILQPMLWFADASPRPGVLHQMLKLFPLAEVQPVLRRELALRRGKVPREAYLLATANASVVLCDKNSVENTFSQAWQSLLSGESVMAADAVIILLRSTQQVEMEAVALSSLEALAAGRVTLQRLDSPLRVALLYASLVERLPLSRGGSKGALLVLRQLLLPRQGTLAMALWRTIGVLRGFRRRIAKLCQSSMGDAASSRGGEEEPRETASAVVRNTFGEITGVLDALAEITPNLSFEEAASSDAPMLFWQQMVALVTETLYVAELLRARATACGTLAGAPQAAEVLVLDDEAETEKPQETQNLEEDVFILTPSKQRRGRPQRRGSISAEEKDEAEEVCNDSANGSGGGVDEFLRGVSAPMEAIGWVARQVLFARPSQASDVLHDALLSFICLCVTLSPVRWDAMEEIALARGLNHSNRVIRHGYAALVVRVLLTRWNDASIVRVFRQNLTRAEGDKRLQQHLCLEALEAAFSGEFHAVLLEQGMCHDGSSPVAASLPLAITPAPEQGQQGAACRSVFEMCIEIWENDTFTMLTRSTALTAAHAIMFHFSWSLAALCWRDAGMIDTSFFEAMCDLEGSVVQEVALACLDDALPHCVLSEKGKEKLQRISLFDEPLSELSVLPRVMAYILLEYAQAPVAEKLEKVQRLLEFYSIPLEDLPERVRNVRAPLIVSLLYLEAGRRLRSADLRLEAAEVCPTEAGNSEAGGVLSNFNLAVELALRVVGCTPSADAVSQALVTPVTVKADVTGLTVDFFHVLDAMAELVGIGPFMVPHDVSPCIVRRCLCSLTLLIQLLGSHATTIAPKLPAILMHCSARPQLLRPVCVVWRELLTNCTAEYLKEHALTIVVDLLSMGQLAEDHGWGDEAEGGPLPLLEASMRIVYKASSQDTFWKWYFQVMGERNALIRRLRGEGGTHPAPLSETRGLEKGLPHTGCNATVVVAGFLSVVQSGSAKCNEAFVRALYQYLRNMDSQGRLEMTRAAELSPQFIPTLLNCACELREDNLECILSCVGMIGAAAHSHAPLLATERDTSSRSVPRSFSPASSGSGALRGMHFLPGEVLDWRTLAHKLLSVYCPWSLANTADPTKHDRAAYAVQQLLRVCTDAERRLVDRLPLEDTEPVDVNELQEYLWWSQLEPKCQQLLAGYTTTRYGKKVMRESELSSPVYKAGLSFHDWLDAWFCDLVERCEGTFGLMMGSLRNMAKGDQVLITCLVPLIIVHLLRMGSDVHFNAVLNEVTNLLHLASPVAPDKGGQDGSLYSQGIMREVATPGSRATGVEEHVQEVFQILENIEHLRLNLPRIVHKIRASRAGTLDLMEVTHVEAVCKRFILRVPWTIRAAAAVGIGSNMRALRHIESQQYLPSVHEVLNQDISLQRIFAALGDRDSSRSLHRTQVHQPEDSAFSYENNGEWGLALQASELVLQHQPNSINHQFTLLRCMQQLGQLHLMSRYSQALLMQYSRLPGEHRRGDSLEWEAKRAALQNYANEASWRLGEWERIETRQDLPISLASPIRAFTNLLYRRGTLREVFSACEAQRQKIAPVIRAAFRESYAQVHPHVVVLHALGDIETATETVTSLRREGKFDEEALPVRDAFLNRKALLQKLAALLQQRARLTETAPETQELLISLHRSIFRALDMKEEVTKTWMRHAKMLRDEGLREAALSAAKQSRLGDGYVDPSYYTTVAKLLYEMNMPNQAVEFAENVVNDALGPLVTRAKLRLLATRWRQETGFQTSQEVIAGYVSALKMNESEKAHHHLALFYEKLYRSIQNSAQEAGASLRASPDDVEDKKLVRNIESYVLQAIHHFGLALRLGSKTMVVSLPRMLTLWLNCSTPLAALTAKLGSAALLADSLLKKLNEMMERFLLQPGTSLPVTQLITALPQLLSRIGQDNTRVVGIVTDTIVKLMVEFPQQCLWQVLPITFGKQHQRSETARNAIVRKFVDRVPNQGKFVERMRDFFKSLIELCNCPAASLVASRSSSQASLAGKPFMQRIQLILPETRIILPTMANLSPNVMRVTENTAVFAGSAAFHSVEERVTIMSSLQKPKRITVISDEGAPVPFLCKARDEPRKDMRMMEIASLMNTFFLTDPEPRRKRFALRRYAVTALSDDCAIIEWVNNLVPFRRVVEDCYAMEGTGVRVSQVKAWKAMVDSGSLTKIDMLRKHIFPKTQPVFHNWFHGHFLSHQEWFNARNCYTQATALWSIAGHIVGLGDRHGENLMLDLRCGELLHVDFACLFDKGESLEIPERVRFRLTQNVVDGMGILGVDGPFRACCELALRCQMKNKTAVMSVVETLLHDPLVEWTRHSSLRQKNFDPRQLIGRVSRRLDGFLDLYSSTREKDTLALSCEGQVSRLISHSSAVENLAEMYVWWMPWL